MSSSHKSQKATSNSLSLLEKLDIIPSLFIVVANTFATIFTGAFRSRETRGPFFYRYVALTTIRTFTRRLSPRQLHYVMPTTDEAYEAVCKKRGVKPESEVLGDGTKAHWIGDKQAEHLILNFHGGGYVLPASANMVDFMFQVISHLESQGKSIAVLFLSYDLAPGAIYPRQLQQAANLLEHVLFNLHIPASKILLTGDSAGANLVLGLLSHISHPWNSQHNSPSPTPPLEIPVIKVTENLCGALLISPWTSFSHSDPSFTTNAYKDCISPGAGIQWSAAFMNTPHPHSSNADFYNHPITAPPSWWKDLKVQDVLVLAGSDEVLVDGIRKFYEGFSAAFGSQRCELFVAEHEYHDMPNVDPGLGYRKPGKQALKVRSWVASKL